MTTLHFSEMCGMAATNSKSEAKVFPVLLACGFRVGIAVGRIVYRPT
jgi:hypothetical protein